MPFKISGVLKWIPFLYQNAKPKRRKCPHLSMHGKKVIKLASVHVMPNVKLLSFRVSKNFLYFSFARPYTDLLEYKELCQQEDDDEAIEK